MQVGAPFDLQPPPPSSSLAIRKLTPSWRHSVFDFKGVCCVNAKVDHTGKNFTFAFAPSCYDFSETSTSTRDQLSLKKNLVATKVWT